LGRGGGTTYTVIREFEAQYVCQVEDDLVFRIIDFGCNDVCLDAIDFFKCPLSRRGVSVKINKAQMREFTISCALIANACKGMRY
jgi:hypothetical protein